MDSQRQLGVIWSYRRWLALLCIVTGAATYVGTSKLPHTYEGTALVQLVPGPQAEGQYVPSDEIVQDMDTYSELARTTDVATLAVQTGHLSIAVNQLQKIIKITPQTDLAVFAIQADDRNPTLAETYANDYAQAFITYVQQRSQTLQNRQASQIQQQVNQVEQQLAGITSSTDPAATSLRTELQTLQTQLALTHAQVGDQVQMVEQATVPTSPATPKPLEDAILAMLSALVVGAALAYVYNLRSDRYESADEARADLGLSLLGEVPIKRNNQRSERQTTEAFRVLRTNIEFTLHGVDHSAVIVTSAEARSGKSFVTENLSRAFAMNGRQTVAIDADLHRPTLHSRLGLASEPGLGQVLERREPARASALVQDVTLPVAAERRGGRLCGLTAGSPIHDPAESLSTPTMGAAVALLRREHDVVVIDSPPLLACVDALAIARSAEGVVLVVDGANGTRRQARRALQMLRAVDTKVLGFVYNRADASRSSYNGYSAYYASEVDPVSLPVVGQDVPIASNGADGSTGNWRSSGNGHVTGDGRLPRDLGEVIPRTGSKR